ncbi:hypothetical protein GCM10022254_15790 [Actinomadura meridiana]|uniref:Uncharacterized protein n=1 Tax=Actinomadura meridiana TaxID=559626 RepID=A0ABP8BVI6_9ACTN
MAPGPSTGTPRPGSAGLLAKLVVPLGATVQVLLLPPGRNPTIEIIGQAVVCTAAAATMAYTVLRFVTTERRRPS